jgi:hypothetical protein
LGLYGDLDSMQTSLNVIMKGAVFPLEKSISESEDEMKNDIVYEDGEELYTTVDYLDYYNNINAKTIIYNSSSRVLLLYGIFLIPHHNTPGQRL